MEQDSSSERLQDHAQSPHSDQELLFETLDGNTDPDPSATTASVGVKSKFSRILQKAKSLTDADLGPETGKLALKREITPLSGIGFVVGQLIGSGIFITPSNILGYTGSFGLSISCWIIGAVVALAGALCYFELGLLVRKAGGEYAILLEAYSFRKKNRWVEMLGSLVSFLFTWTTVFVLRGASASIITLTCARYLTRPFFIGCEVPESVVKLIALAALRRFLCLV
jgi:L-type amino acid transporter 9